MPNDNVATLIQPGAFEDPLTQVLRDGARTLLAQAVEAEVVECLTKHAGVKTEDGRSRVVRHGHLPEREVMPGIGPVTVCQPRVRDRGAEANSAERIRFTHVTAEAGAIASGFSHHDEAVAKSVSWAATSSKF